MKKSYTVTVQGTFQERVILQADSESEARELALDTLEEWYDVVSEDNIYDWKKVEVLEVLPYAIQIPIESANYD
jgi:formylmethanofuran dehydrogenase subunit E